MRPLFFLIIFLTSSTVLVLAQHNVKKDKHFDSSVQLQEVIVKAFQSNTQWKAVPAAVATVTSNDLARYANTSLVPVLNVIPGIRMEERSPASYRLSIRGSLLRSPFGVRNVKVYWNELPLTDAGGNTYLNLVDMTHLTGVEILKGPVASVYGAGTGGALLLRSEIPFSLSGKNQYELGLTGGSYGLFQQQAGWQHTDSAFTSSLQQSHLQSDGYREQSAMRRDAVKWQASFQRKKQQFQMLFFYTDLFYQTPGGITLAQYQQDPKSARQPGGGFPGAVQQKTAIYNTTFFAGIHHTVVLNNSLNLKTFVTGNSVRFKNPFITNYEKRAEDNVGSGVNLIYHTRYGNNALQWVNGAEWLYNHTNIQDFGNRAGILDTVQFKDNIYAVQWFIFSQLTYKIADKWNFTTGLSLNNQSYRFRRLTDPGSAYAGKHINAVLTPRLAILYSVNRNLSLYALTAKGFSPPALAELRPADRNFHGDLQAEQGWNYEAGIKGMVWDQRLQFDLAAYYFSLKDAIVRRNNSAGAEYFINAGGTIEKGLEGILKYALIRNNRSFIRYMDMWSSYSYQPYRFDDYRQGTADYSGNALTGVPQNVWISGIDMETHSGAYANLSLNCTSALPRTAANDAYATAYQLLQMKIGYRWKVKQQEWHMFAGVDNALDQVYSLGNDINAAGKRYYNAAAGRSFLAGIHFLFR
ncbi:MAG: TonB-dependent receptor [Sediminibacterium sp.]